MKYAQCAQNHDSRECTESKDDAPVCGACDGHDFGVSGPPPVIAHSAGDQICPVFGIEQWRLIAIEDEEIAALRSDDFPNLNGNTHHAP